MKKYFIILLAVMLGAGIMTGCGKEKESKAPATETYVEENEKEVVYHDTEDVNFRIAVIEGEMLNGLERLMDDAKKDEAANRYHFYRHKEFANFESLLEFGTIDIATISLEEALKVNAENPELICLISVNAEMKEGYGVTVANRTFARTYPLALKVFIEEMSYSAKDAVCIMGQEMKALVENYLSEQGAELPGDDFYYPLLEESVEEIENAEESGTND
jgi:hypothetical protein